MTTERFHLVEKLFHEAAALDPEARKTFLDEACGGDDQLRSEVESLLDHADDIAESWKLQTGDPDSSLGTDQPTGEAVTKNMGDGEGTRLKGMEQPGDMIGRYKLLQKIGEGGFGVVYMAEQQEPVRRKVALKIIKLGMDTKQVVARLEAERQALAMMDHPNIARVLDAGATERGRPFFVMELVRGISITEYCDRNKLSTRERLELFIPVCHAVQHAHQKGIIHRDIKPSNVLVTLHDTKPVPKVIDFGIAKAMGQRLTDKTLFTEFRQFIGTPEYMSPDQAEISGLDVDTRTDIYSLGVLLYELLTGTTPFDAQTLRRAAYVEIQRIIREVEPPKPSTRLNTLATSESADSDVFRTRRAEPRMLSKIMRGDLDWIVMKSLEKDRTRRYQSASELAADIQRHLNSEPILAGPPSIFYKFHKFIQRHRVGVLAASVVVLAMIFGLSLATAGFVRARHEARRNQKIADFLQDLLITTNPDDAMAQKTDVDEIVQTAREIFGEDHATVAATLTSRATQLQSVGRLVSAERLYRESLRIWQETAGENDPRVAVTMGKLGMLLQTKGDNEAAEKTLRQALDIFAKQPGGMGLTSCDSSAMLASLLANRGESDEAVSLLRNVLAIRKREAPEQKLQIALTTNSIANLLLLSGRNDDLKTIMPDVLSTWREALPADSPFLAQVLIETGVWFSKFDSLQTAQDVENEALGIIKNGSTFPERNTFIALSTLQDIYKKRWDAGEDLNVKALQELTKDAAVLLKTSPKYHYQLLKAVTDTFHTADYPVLALSACREALDTARSMGDEELIKDAERELGVCAWGIACKIDAAREDYEAGLQVINELLQDHPDDPAYTNTLGILLFRVGDYEHAVEQLRKSDEWYSAQTPGGAPADIAFIAMAQYVLGNEKEASEALQRLYTVMRNTANAASQLNQQFLKEAEGMIRKEDSDE